MIDPVPVLYLHGFGNMAPSLFRALLFGGSTMSKVCDICGKHPVAGRSVSHSHRTVNRTFKPNIQRVTVYENGRSVKRNVCTRCLKKGNIARSAAQA